MDSVYKSEKGDRYLFLQVDLGRSYEIWGVSIYPKGTKQEFLDVKASDKFII